MPKVTLGKAVRYPFGSRVVHPAGAVLEVSAVDERRLRELRVVAVDGAVPVGPEIPLEGSEEFSPEGEKRGGRKFPPLPKKSQGVNAWREYARDHDIDVRGLSEKAELVGHITKVVTSAGVA